MGGTQEALELMGNKYISLTETHVQEKMSALRFHKLQHEVVKNNPTNTTKKNHEKMFDSGYT